MFNRDLARRRFRAGVPALATFLALFLGSLPLSHPLAADETDAAVDASDSTEDYDPPRENRRITEAPPDRALHRVLSDTGAAFADRWTLRSTQELGSSQFQRMFARQFPGEQIDRLTAEFEEGYSHFYENLPEFVTLYACRMQTDGAAQIFHEFNIESLQSNLVATSEHEDADIDFISEQVVSIPGIDEVVEKRYVLHVGNLPPSTYHILFARIGRFTVTVSAMQSNLAAEQLRGLLQDLGNRIRSLEGGTAAASAPSN